MIDYQEIFNAALFGIRAQGGYSTNTDGGCVYRSTSGRKCGIGHNIPDERYSPELEGATPREHDVQFALCGTRGLHWKDVRFLDDVQAAHDISAECSATDDLDHFERAMLAMARKYKLRYTPANEEPEAGEWGADDALLFKGHGLTATHVEAWAEHLGYSSWAPRQTQEVMLVKVPDRTDRYGMRWVLSSSSRARPYTIVTFRAHR